MYIQEGYMRGRVDLTSNTLILKMAPNAGIIVLLRKLPGMEKVMVKTEKDEDFIKKYSSQKFHTCCSIDL